MMATHRSGLIANPITHKINEKHIDKILEITEKDDVIMGSDQDNYMKFQ